MTTRQGIALKGKVLITGGAGFIGRAIMARAEAENWDCEFTIFSRDEQKQDYVRRRFGDRSRCLLGDVRDPARLRLVCAGHDIVVHAAALKYIPEAEDNVQECVEVNLLGSQSVIEATRGMVNTVVFLSTDKAVMPLNVYGATKMLAERLFVEASERSLDTSYAVVRYGNVIGSTGSVIPLFKTMAVEGKPITITDPDMTRFWLTSDEAIDIILWSTVAAFTERSFVLIPWARSMRLMDLLTAVAPGAAHNIIGRRPGEKIHEALLSEYEAMKAVDAGPYVMLKPKDPPRETNLRPVTSDTPAAGWFDIDTMREAIRAAEQI